MENNLVTKSDTNRFHCIYNPYLEISLMELILLCGSSSTVLNLYPIIEILFSIMSKGNECTLLSLSKIDVIFVRSLQDSTPRSSPSSSEDFSLQNCQFVSLNGCNIPCKQVEYFIVSGRKGKVYIFVAYHTPSHTEACYYSCNHVPKCKL